MFSEKAWFIPGHKGTISAAIEYAHMQTALGVVVKDAHRLLDEVAKDQCGRDGLACRVWKRGGPVLTWAQPWKWVLGEPPEPAIGSGKATLVEEVCFLFQDGEDKPTQFSSKFFYKVRDLFELLAPDGAFVSPIDVDIAKKILVTEYLANRAQSWPGNPPLEDKRKMAEERVQRLLDLCHQQKRAEDGTLHPTPNGLSADGALLIRFLSQKEV